MEVGDFRTSFKVKLGSGNFGSVFLGENTKDGSFVAFKLAKMPKVLPTMTDMEKRRAECIVRGIQTERFVLSQFNHPHLLRKFDSVPVLISQGEEMALFVLEYCDNGTLLDFALSGQMPLTESNIKSIISQILSGLKKLHDSGIIHRDLNLRNILVSGSTLKIADFGCSKNLDDGDAVTQIRTENFAAPEVGRGVYSYKADIYSLAIILEKLMYISIGMPDPVKPLSGSELMNRTGFSFDCFNFLFRTRDVNPSSRADWPEIISHPWLAGQFVTIDNVLLTIHSPPLPSPLPTTPSVPSSPSPAETPEEKTESQEPPASSSSSSSSMLSWIWPFSWFSSNEETKVKDPLPSSEPETEEVKPSESSTKEVLVEKTTEYLKVAAKKSPMEEDVERLAKMVYGELKSIFRISTLLRHLQPADSFILLKFLIREISGSISQFKRWGSDPSLIERFSELEKRLAFEALDLTKHHTLDPNRDACTVLIEFSQSVLDEKDPREEDVNNATAALIYLTKSEMPDPRLAGLLLRMITLWNDLSNSSVSSQSH
eukprot:TRINITY_DN7383_c0_g1_i1.p1 TRINITY_DN7383_c0_g1~~TRINITY_DN7383_c0_g1_i1.p1  ORF type:complete len:543 (+),score=198.78 TRINITY_DN7383_c0_g1_i1:92-1720(+)